MLAFTSSSCLLEKKIHPPPVHLRVFVPSKSPFLCTWKVTLKVLPVPVVFLPSFFLRSCLQTIFKAAALTFAAVLWCWVAALLKQPKLSIQTPTSCNRRPQRDNWQRFSDAVSSGARSETLSLLGQVS